MLQFYSIGMGEEEERTCLVLIFIFFLPGVSNFWVVCESFRISYGDRHF